MATYRAFEVTGTREFSLVTPDLGAGSFASLGDPDHNGWVIQEVKVRAPGR